MTRRTRLSRDSPAKTSRMRSAHLVLDPDWEYLSPLRETALSYLPADDLARLAQGFATWVLTEYMEQAAGPFPTFRGSRTKAELRAALCDLRHTARFLSMVAEPGFHSDASPSERRLSRFADGLALRVERLAGEIDRQITPRARRKLIRQEGD